MLIAHLADLHLGYRAYHRLAHGGINARERDVALAFRAVLDRLIELRPALIVIAGDVFHSVRPSNAAIADAFRQFSRLRAALPKTPIVMIAGEHDSPRSVETGSILRLFAEIPGIHVMDQEARTVYFEELQTSVLGVPHTPLAAGEPLALTPDPNAAVNILVLHAALIGLGSEKLSYISEYGGAELDVGALDRRWDYIALGHHHVATEMMANAWYAGGIERTSASVWKEVEPKGFLTFDTDTRKVTHQKIETRTMVDLKAFSARSPVNGNSEPAFMDAKEIDARIAALLGTVPDGIEGKIVRLVIYDLPREVFRELDHRRLREYRATALHFHLDARRPEARRAGLIPGEGRRRTLEQELEWFMREHWRPVQSETDKERVLNLGHYYLAEVTSLDADVRETEDNG